MKVHMNQVLLCCFCFLFFSKMIYFRLGFKICGYRLLWNFFPHKHIKTILLEIKRGRYEEIIKILGRGRRKKEHGGREQGPEYRWKGL